MSGDPADLSFDGAIGTPYKVLGASASDVSAELEGLGWLERLALTTGLHAYSQVITPLQKR